MHRQTIYRHITILCLLAAVVLAASACLGLRERTPAERALAGTWVSESNPRSFIFHEDGSYTVDTGEGRINATYREINQGETLRNKQFLLDRSGITIQFGPDGESFTAQLDGVPLEGTWQRQAQS
jgi:hypothetical protein